MQTGLGAICDRGHRRGGGRCRLGADCFRYEQDIERAEVRSEVTVNGNPLSLKSWVASDQPFVICEMRNTSDKPITCRISTWTYPAPDGKALPFRIVPFEGNGSYFGIYENNGKIVYGEPPQDASDFWSVEKAGKNIRFKNAVTGHYLVAAGEGVEARGGKPDAAAEWIDRGAWPTVHWLTSAKTGRIISLDEGSVACRLTPSADAGSPFVSATTFMAFEPAGHLFVPSHAGNDGAVCWALRSKGPSACAAIVTRVIAETPAVAKDGSLTLTLAPGAAATVVAAICGDYNTPSAMQPAHAYRDMGRQMVMATNADAISRMAEQRRESWKQFWLTTWLDLGDRTLNRYWYGAFYAMRCAQPHR